MSIEKIEKFMLVPAAVTETENHDWQNIENTIKIGLPTDYKRFLAKYGTGSIGNFLWILNPFSENDFLNLNAVYATIDAYEVLHSEFPKYNPRKNGTFFLGLSQITAIA